MTTRQQLRAGILANLKEQADLLRRMHDRICSVNNNAPGGESQETIDRAWLEVLAARERLLRFQCEVEEERP